MCIRDRDRINKQITAILDEATDRWGIKVSRVELKNILPPREIQDSMEKQMKAERESREKILLAEGEKKSKDVYKRQTIRCTNITFSLHYVYQINLLSATVSDKNL